MITLAEALELIRAKQEKALPTTELIDYPVPKTDVSAFAGIISEEEARELKQILADNFDSDDNHEG
jgi:hypothetical protein